MKRFLLIIILLSCTLQPPTTPLLTFDTAQIGLRPNSTQNITFPCNPHTGPHRSCLIFHNLSGSGNWTKFEWIQKTIIDNESSYFLDADFVALTTDNAGLSIARDHQAAPPYVSPDAFIRTTVNGFDCTSQAIYISSGTTGGLGICTRPPIVLIGVIYGIAQKSTLANASSFLVTHAAQQIPP